MGEGTARAFAAEGHVNLHHLPRDENEANSAQSLCNNRRS